MPDTGSMLGGMFATPQQQPSRVDKISAALMGFGAGVRGRGQEFLAGLREEQQQLSQQRQMAMVRDAMTVDTLLANNRIDDALALTGDRVQKINELGGDPSDTLQVYDMLRTGNAQGARQMIGEFLGQAQQAGLIPGAQTIKPSDLVDGELIQQDPLRGITRQRIADPQATEGFRTLASRAEAAGLVPGTPEYQQFMAQGGAPERGAATDIGKLRQDLLAGIITPEEFDQQLASLREGPRDTAREQRIKDLMDTFGMTRQEAIRSIESRPMIDDRGNLIRYDPTSDTGRLIDVDVGEAPEAIPRPGRVSQEDLSFDPGKGTGFGASFLGLWNSTLGQVPFLPIAQGPEEAAQMLRIIERDAINALATSSRPAVVEQNRIIQTIPRSMEWMENPEVARNKMTSFVDLMTNQYVDDLRYMRDRRNPRALREESGRRASEIERIVNRVLTPEAAKQMFDTINRVEGEIGEISGMSDSELMQMDPAQMTDAQLDVFIQRLSNGR